MANWLAAASPSQKSQNQNTPLLAPSSFGPLFRGHSAQALSIWLRGRAPGLGSRFRLCRDLWYTRRSASHRRKLCARHVT